MATARSVILTVLLIVLIRGVIFEPYFIPSGSMYSTLREGDIVLGSKLSYGLRIPFTLSTLIFYRPIKRRDVVIFVREDDPRTPENEEKNRYVKRVIGLPGDVVEVKGTEVFVNDTLLEEPYARYSHGGLVDFPRSVVPPGKVFLLGDNRDESLDSRSWPNPFLPLERIHGKVMLVVISSSLDRFWLWID